MLNRSFLSRILITCLCVNTLVPSVNAQQSKKPTTQKTQTNSSKYTAYLFTYFTGNSKAEEAIRFAISKDGYNFKALNENKPVINSESISETGGVRDPHILRGNDGTFYMVATDMTSSKGWNSNRAMVLMKSNDLIHWKSSVVNFQKRFAGNDSLLRVWAPQTIYDPVAKKYMVYYSLKHGNDPDKIYYSYANADFTDLETEPKQLFFSPTNSACIDGDIVLKDGKYHLFFKGESGKPGIKLAISDNLTEGYKLIDEAVQQTKDPVEGAGVFKLNDGSGYILMYDVYTKGKYQFTKSADLKKFEVVDHSVSMDFHPRHGTVLPITTAEAESLIREWMPEREIMLSARAAGLKTINVSLDGATNKITLPVKPNVDLRTFNPTFSTYPGVTVQRISNTGFAAGPVKYKVEIKGKAPVVFQVEAKKNHNPVLDGYYADPDVLYSHKTGKYYIYPTSDGFTGWSGTYFKTFSSPDLVNWKDEGVILDLEKDVTWAKRNAWAPCILEKKIGDKYKYFYYFTAAQKIGVAVADDPTGPFTDLGKPLVDQRPEGTKGGQIIDPDIFEDPKTGKVYLYYGNGYMAVCELNDDLVSIKPGTTKIITPDKTFREGTTVNFRNGKYYFMWSEDDTRSVNYKVRYGVATDPTGPISVPENNIVIQTDKTSGIYATGHNSVLQIPGKDEWYLVYHRFNYPKGITMGDAAGYNREVCIDKLEFDAEGNIKQVKPTHEGVEAVVKK